MPRRRTTRSTVITTCPPRSASSGPRSSSYPRGARPAPTWRWRLRTGKEAVRARVSSDNPVTWDTFRSPHDPCPLLTTSSAAWFATLQQPCPPTGGRVGARWLYLGLPRDRGTGALALRTAFPWASEPSDEAPQPPCAIGASSNGCPLVSRLGRRRPSPGGRPQRHLDRANLTSASGRVG